MDVRAPSSARSTSCDRHAATMTPRPARCTRDAVGELGGGDDARESRRGELLDGGALVDPREPVLATGEQAHAVVVAVGPELVAEPPFEPIAPSMTAMGCNPASVHDVGGELLLLCGRRAIEDLEATRRRQCGPHGGDRAAPPRRARPRATPRAPIARAAANRRRGRNARRRLGAGSGRSRSCSGVASFDGRRRYRRRPRDARRTRLRRRPVRRSRRPTDRACRRRSVATHHAARERVIRLRWHLLAAPRAADPMRPVSRTPRASGTEPCQAFRRGRGGGALRASRPRGAPSTSASPLGVRRTRRARG